MKILFICKHNRFRSKVAETIFNKLNKNKNIAAESAGLIMDDARPFIEGNVIGIMKQMAYDITGTPLQLTRELVKKFDKIVIVADNVSPDFFHDFKGEIIHWKIEDCDASDIICIKKIILDIEKNVKELGK